MNLCIKIFFYEVLNDYFKTKTRQCDSFYVNLEGRNKWKGVGFWEVRGQGV